MEAPLPTLLQKHPREVKFFSEIFNSPQKTTVFLVGISVFISALLFAGLLISQNLTAENELAKQKQAKQDQTRAANENAAKTATKQDQIFDETRRGDLIQIQGSLRKFNSKNSYYPSSLATLLPDYLSRIPQDPETKKEYFYQSAVDQKGYILRATLSNGEEFEVSN